MSGVTILRAAEGTAFPASPATNDRFFRTDRGIEYYYDGTRWVSITLYNDIIDSVAGLAATDTPQRPGVAWAGTYDLWLVDFYETFFISGGTALSASHKWVTTVVKNPVASTIATYSIDSGASDAWRTSGAVAINALLGTTNYEIDVTHTKTGTPGTLYLTPRLTYRLVG